MQVLLLYFVYKNKETLSALSSMMLPRCPGWAWLNRSCQARTVGGWLEPMVRSQVRAQARAERCYRLLSCPGSAAAAEQQQCSNSSITSYLKERQQQHQTAADKGPHIVYTYTYIYIYIYIYIYTL